MTKEIRISLADPLPIQEPNMARPSAASDESANAAEVNDIACSGLAKISQPKIAHEQPMQVQIFDLEDVAARIKEVFSDMPQPNVGLNSPQDDPSVLSCEDGLPAAEFSLELGVTELPRDTSSLSHEETHRYRNLLRLARDPAMGKRDALIGSAARLDAVNALRMIAPHFETVIAIIADAIAVSARTSTALIVPPICLLGPPGIGKTFFARRLAAALGTAYHLLPMNISSSFSLLAGLSTAWRGAKPGKLATTLVEGSTAAPVLVFDELEKVIMAGPFDRPLDVLHSLWERENASMFVDEYYDIRFDTSHVISISTANAVGNLSSSLLDRLLVIDVPPPNLDQRRHIAEQIFERLVTRLGNAVRFKLPDHVLDDLTTMTPRRISRVLELALPRAMAAGREAVSRDDIRAVAQLLDAWRGKPKAPIGFINL